MLGLKKGAATVLPYDPQWEAAAWTAIETLKTILGDAAVDIQHVGSTAIPSIHAKPVVDIAVGMRNVKSIAPLVGELEQHGIFLRPYRRPEIHPDQLLFIMVDGSVAEDTRTHNIHVLPYGSETWTNYIDFRDYLCAHPDRAAEYDALKVALSAAHPDDRVAYTAGKEVLIDRLLAEAHGWRKAVTV